MKRKNRKEARRWLFDNDIRQVDIQRALEQKYDTQVHSTLHGDRSDRRVLQYLLDIGCPADYLDLPEDMKEMA